MTLVPSGLPDRMWLVIAPNGERHFVVREPPEGIAEWAKGTDARVFEYKFTAVAYTPKKKELPK